MDWDDDRGKLQQSHPASAEGYEKMPGVPPLAVSHPANEVKIKDAVNHPDHYGGGDNLYEAVKVIEAWKLPWHLGDAVKYIARHGKKDPTKTIEDLKKARWYLDRYIGMLEMAQVDRSK